MKASKIISIVGCSLLAAVAIAAPIAAHQFEGIIDDFLDVTDHNFDGEEFKEAAAASDALCQKIAEEGIAMVRNERKTLPYANKKVNVFGWASTRNGFLLSGIGSGSSTIQEDKAYSLLDAFEEEGWEVNEELASFYTSYDNSSFKPLSGSRITTIEPEVSKYSDALIQNAQDFSDQAIVVISRVSGENVGEIPLTMPQKGQGSDPSRTYLHLSQREEDLIRMVTEKFGKVTVIINSSNTMELGFLEDYDVGAALNVTLLGQSGALAIPRILSGEINPSGRVTDTFPYVAGVRNDSSSDPLYAPSFRNFEARSNNIGYLENIYVGYRFYETADKEGYWNGVDNDYGSDYDAVVQYPFGHGLSYTSFKWSYEGLFDDQGNATTIDPTDAGKRYTMRFSCQNTGSVAGKDVIQVYGHVPYVPGGIEKSSIQLLDFAKSATLEPGKTQQGIECSFRLYDLASFDDYDRDDDGHYGYELDKGEYTFTFNENAHVLKDMDGDTSIKVTLNEQINIDRDPITGKDVKPRFTGEDAYGNMPLDGSKAYATAPVHLSREEGFFGWGEKIKAIGAANVGGAGTYTNTSFDQDTMPVTGVDKGIRIYKNGKFDEEIVDEIGDDYDSDLLTDLVDQLTIAELKKNVECSGFGTPALPSVGKPECFDFDGPAGFNQNTTKQAADNGKWTAFPCEVLIGQTWNKQIAYQMGSAAASEAAATGLNGWYAPGVNIHRTPFAGRNYEYYSEDPLLSGKMGAMVCLGAKNHGLYVYIKHFTMAEEGPNPRNVNTWVTEQAYREIYLRPFEIAVKEGKTVGVMTGFNNIGAIWCGSCSAQNNDILRDEWGFRGSVITDWSAGDNVMNPTRGIRGGNDIWLNPNTSSGAPLDMNNATTVYCAKIAARNVLFTFINTHYTFTHYDTSLDEVKVNIGSFVADKKVFPWRGVLVGVEIALGVGIVAWLGLVWVLPIIRKKAN
ncbi:MAG: glycoside hydrolase family 3 C-terminal domain-containing protein [Bacilli bacterium]|nr:glycoside hydrolase family 3 C-terminal domain-containing protein [Bacilli bacterium]